MAGEMHWMSQMIIQELISTLTKAGLVVQFRGCEDSNEISARILAPEEEWPRGAATAKTPERALALAAARGLASIYHRVRGGFISLEETP